MVLKVVLVDDSVFMRGMLEKLVVEAGAKVIGQAGDGNEAITIFEKEKPDLVFLDIVMPNMTGLEALKKMKSMDTNAKIIMCSSVGQEKIVVEAVEAGATDFIVKPFKAEDIKTVIKKFS